MTGAKADKNISTLRECKFFAQVSAKGLKRAASAGSFVTYKPGEEIVSHQNKTDTVFFLLSGRARVVAYSAAGRAIDYGRIQAGTIFGEFAAVDGRARSASVETVQLARVLRLSAGEFWALLEGEPAFARQLVIHLVAMARSLTERVYEFSTLTVSNRIQAELLRLIRESTSAGGQAILAPPPKHAEIAARVSTHREAVTREFSRLTELGVIERKRHGLIVKDLARLEKMVHEATGE